VTVGAPYWVFWIPSLLLWAFVLIDFFVVRDCPKDAGLQNIETGDASSGEDDRPDPVGVILKKVLTNPIVLTIGAIEFCTGVLRQGIMHWYPIFSKDMGYYRDFVVTENWGAMLFVAGATGGMTAGWISDRVFGSRRGPVATLLYALMFLAVAVMAFSLSHVWVLGVCVFLISYCVIGTHGMLSGTASMDFGGRKNVGTAVGLIDGLVYLGTGLQSICLGFLTMSGRGWTHGGYLTDVQKGWSFWPVFLLPFSVIGAVLAIRIWKALPEAARRRSG
jgi:OPA family glycerol-3-phosphate transporter-like MFS transporter